MSRPEAERSRRLLARADADLAAVRALEANEDVPGEIVGFHAQQAAEKLLKAVLTAHAVAYPRTHSIRYLLDLLAEHGLAPPDELDEVKELYPFAVQLRYEALGDDEPFDRRAAKDLLERLRAWAAEQITAT